MRSVKRGRATSDVEVTNVSPHGFWLLVGDAERFVSFGDFPWFRIATIGALANVVQQRPGHLYWPELDIDLAVESIEHPERYPLVSRVAERSDAAARYSTRVKREKKGKGAASPRST